MSTAALPRCTRVPTKQRMEQISRRREANNNKKKGPLAEVMIGRNGTGVRRPVHVAAQITSMIRKCLKQVGERAVGMREEWARGPDAGIKMTQANRAAWNLILRTKVAVGRAAGHLVREMGLHMVHQRTLTPAMVLRLEVTTARVRTPRDQERSHPLRAKQLGRVQKRQRRTPHQNSSHKGITPLWQITHKQQILMLQDQIKNRKASIEPKMTQHRHEEYLSQILLTLIGNNIMK